MIRLDVSCYWSARQPIHMKLQALFSLKNEEKNHRMSSANIFNGTLTIKL